MPISEVTDVAKFIIDKISNSLLCLQKNHYYIYQSITAGNDSRMSFVAAKNLLNKIHFFTYCKFNSFAKLICLINACFCISLFSLFQ